MNNDGLLLDEDGLPVLTNSISPDESSLTTSPLELAKALLDSEVVRQKLDEIAARMTVNARQEMETAIRPAIEEAVSQALNVSGDNIYLATSKHLEAALPDLLSHVMQTKDSS